MDVFGKSDCIREKVVVFGKRGLYSGKSNCIREKWLYSAKVAVFGKSGCTRLKVVVFE